MVVSANGGLVLGTLEDLEILIEAETQELHEQFSKYKKYEKELKDLEEWEMGDTTGFIGGIEKLIKSNKLSKDNEYRLAVYIGRYPSYFISINDQGLSRGEALRDRLLILKTLSSEIDEYIKVLIELQ